MYFGEDLQVVCEEFNRTSHENARARKKRRLVNVGIVAGIAALSLFVNDVYDRITQSGKGKVIEAIVDERKKPDPVLQICDINVQQSAASRRAMLTDMEEQGCDPLLIQEVPGNDMNNLGAYFPNKNIVTVQGDALKIKPLEGGLGNVLLTSHEPRDVKRVSISGTPLAEGLLALGGRALSDIIEGEALANTSDELQEDRGALATTIKFSDEGKEKDVRIITGHITGALLNGEPDETQRLLHVSQLEKLIEFIEKNTHEGTPTVFCGDLNSSREELERVFSDIGFVLAENKSGRTSVNNDAEPDVCAYYGAGVLGRGVVVVLREYATDHYAIQISFNGDQSNNPVEYFDQRFHEKK